MEGKLLTYFSRRLDDLSRDELIEIFVGVLDETPREGLISMLTEILRAIPPDWTVIDGDRNVGDRR